MATKKSAKKPVSKKSVAKNAKTKTASQKMVPAKNVKSAKSEKVTRTDKGTTKVTGVASAAKTAKLAKVVKGSASTKNSLRKSLNKNENWESFFQPLGDRILVELTENERRTPGGLIIPDSVEGEKRQRARVLAVGPGKRSKKGTLRPVDVQPGDNVILSEWSGTKVTMRELEVVILNESDVLGVVD